MLSENEIIPYWSERAHRLKATAVGYGDKALSEQDKHYQITTDFIKANIDVNLNTIDYGCGIGRYSPIFKGKYVGVDVSEELLQIAKKNNENCEFKLLSQPFLPKFAHFSSDLEQFFTATVLQHINDDMVHKVYQSLFNLNPYKLKTIVAYENSENWTKPHVVGRMPELYVKFITDVGFRIDNIHYNSIIVKGEKHTLTLIDLKPMKLNSTRNSNETV